MQTQYNLCLIPKSPIMASFCINMLYPPMGSLCTALPYPTVGVSNSSSLSSPHTQLPISCLICYNYVPSLENQISHIDIIRHHSSPDQPATDNITPPASSHSKHVGAGLPPVPESWLPGLTQEHFYCLNGWAHTAMMRKLRHE